MAKQKLKSTPKGRRSAHNKTSGKYLRQRSRTSANKVRRIRREIAKGTHGEQYVAYLKEREHHWLFDNRA